MIAVVLFLALASHRVAAEQILYAADFARSTNGWQNVAFLKNPTQYTLGREGTNCFLKGLSNRGCSAFSTQLDLNPPHHLTLRWRWRISGSVTNGSERDLSRFDHAARIFLAFDTFIGPPRTLVYLWANAESVGAFLKHPKSGRSQLVMVESGNAKAGQWITEERDVTADWKRAFPDMPMPKLVDLGVMTDSDSLGERLEGDYAFVELLGE